MELSRSTKTSSRGKRNPLIGKYVLDSLSFGMYNHPFMVLREYIQNSVDAIDDYVATSNCSESYEGSIYISIDGQKKSIRVTDNGIGIAPQKAWHLLHDLGRSEKDGKQNRGFRGIGRLGGLGYCDELIFTTKAEGEDRVIVSSWDCIKVRNLLNDKSNRINTASVIEHSITYNEEKYSGNICDHFFIVEMKCVHSNRDSLLNVPAVKTDLAQVAPVPFNPESFKFTVEIDKTLRENVPSYNTYSIWVNNENIFKPYCDQVGIHDHGLDSVNSIDCFQLSDDQTMLAFGWLGNLKLLGTIWQSTSADGLRLRAGNIQIGNKDALSDLYREKRFNNYMLGEIHVVHNRLIPNSRRDDFEDNEFRDSFQNCFIRDVGIPFSKKIRDLSTERSKQKRLDDAESICARAKAIINRGYIAEAQKYSILEKLQKQNGNKPDGWTDKDVKVLITELQNSKHFLNTLNSFSSIAGKDILERVFEVLYHEADSKVRVGSIVDGILSNIPYLPSD